MEGYVMVIVVFSLVYVAVRSFINFAIHGEDEHTRKTRTGKLIDYYYDTGAINQGFAFSGQNNQFSTECIVTFLLDDNRELTLYSYVPDIIDYKDQRIEFV